MAIDPPYRLDPFRNIINVHWGEEQGSTSEISQYADPAESRPGYFFISTVAVVGIEPASGYPSGFFWCNNWAGNWYLIAWDPTAYGWSGSMSLQSFVAAGGTNLPFEGADGPLWYFGPGPPPEPLPY